MSFKLKPNKELIPYSEYYFSVGFDDLRVKISDESVKVHSNLGIPNTTAFATEKNAEALFGVNERDQEGEQYEFYRIFFEEE